MADQLQGPQPIPNAPTGAPPAQPLPSPDGTARVRGVAAVPGQTSSATAPSTGETPTAPPNQNGQLGTDPAYLTYMRNLGISDSDAQAAAQQAIGRVQARIQNSAADLARAQQSADLNAGTRLANSGMLDSSTGRFELAQQGANYAARQAALQQSGPDQIAQLLANLTLAYQRGATGAANAALTAAPTVALNDAAANNYGIGGA